MLELCSSVFALCFAVRIFGQTIKRLHFLRSALLITMYIARYQACPNVAVQVLCFVSNGIPNFEALIRKSIFSFNSRLQTTCNSLIRTIEQSWIAWNVIWKIWDEKL